MSGKSGPPPKRESQRRRRNQTEPVERALGLRADPPPADGDWHPVARLWYESLPQSGQAAFYEASDWATAYMIAEAMSRELHPQPMRMGRGSDTWIEMVTLPPKGASIAAWLKAMSSLLVSEGERRRVRLELEKAPEVDPHEEAAVADLASYRKRVASD